MPKADIEVLSRGADKTAQLAAARARIAELETEIARLSARDPLVSTLLTLPAFRAQLELDVQRAQRYGRPLVLAVLDIDRFRHLNMTRGYGVGDLVLSAVGERLTASTRAHDLACRAGGDEFLLLLPETELDDARAVLERLLVDLENVVAAEQRGVSLSIGLAALSRGESADSLLGQAQQALELARDEGGGRVKVAEGSGAETGEDTALGATAEVVAVLAQALEERDTYTGEHSESVVDLTARVAEELALDSHEVKTIRSAALLHDIGKVGIPDEILHKPGPLDEREWEIMRQHPAIGERILRAIPGMGAVARIVRHEHERWDGTGYPDRLAGEAIPVGARIILACDAYHAMTSDRPYRAAMSHHLAMSELTSNAGSQFDPKVIEALVGYLYGRRQSGLAAV
jgi:diguanylate cyclase (GGDEF)-like protein/putative nucleotidyltransferase with HDIG domain